MSDFSSKTPNDKSSYDPHMFNRKSSGTGAGRDIKPSTRPDLTNPFMQMKGKKGRSTYVAQSTRPDLTGPFLQKQLKVGSSSDPLEREADAVADKIMRMPAGDKNTVRRQEAVPEEEELPISRKEKSGGEAAIAPETQAKIESARSGGQALPASERDFFEPRFGKDLSDVRVHTDSKAAEASQDINARAFTIGNDVFFNAGEYKPGTGDGRFLMAHELTHTLQQSGGVQRDVIRRKRGLLDVIVDALKGLLGISKPFLKLIGDALRVSPISPFDAHRIMQYAKMWGQAAKLLANAKLEAVYNDAASTGKIEEFNEFVQDITGVSNVGENVVKVTIIDKNGAALGSALMFLNLKKGDFDKLGPFTINMLMATWLKYSGNSPVDGRMEAIKSIANLRMFQINLFKPAGKSFRIESLED